MAPGRGRRGALPVVVVAAASIYGGLPRGGRRRWLGEAAFLAPAASAERGLDGPWPDLRRWQTSATRAGDDASGAPPTALYALTGRAVSSALSSGKTGWQRFNDQESWAFLLGASPFSYSQVVANTKREKYMDNLVWTSENEVPENALVDCDNSTYPPAFTSYLSRLLLARDTRCAAWWSGALQDSDEAPELIFARLQASVALTLECKWASAPGSLAAALIKRFGGRFPFDAVPQVRLLFSLLSTDDKPHDSFFDQAFSTDRDELMEVFLVMDADGNGMLSATDIQDTIERIGGGWVSQTETEQMLGDALANSEGEVDFNGFKEAITNSHKASRARAARGWSDNEWWRDPAALLPANMLDDATPELLLDAHRRFEEVQRTALDEAKRQTPKATPLVREKMGLKVYLLLMLAGGFACTITHVALVPIDVVKTLQQSEPDHFKGVGLLTATTMLWQAGGLRLLFLGFVPTCVGYLWYGAMVFPLYELFKRKLLALCGPRRGEMLRVPLVLLSGALATFFACIGVCPAEAVRIRTVTEYGFQFSFLGNVAKLYAGFAPLLFRQVLFGMAKFLMFDTVKATALRLVPWFRRTKSTMLVCSLFSGGAAGLMATFVSQPSDAILTRVANSNGLGILGGAASLFAEGGLGAFFVGFGTRAIWASCIIAGQFLFYDIAKQVFKVTAADLTEKADAVTTALRTREPALEFGAQPVPQLDSGSQATSTPAKPALSAKGALGFRVQAVALARQAPLWGERLQRQRRMFGRTRAAGGG